MVVTKLNPFWFSVRPGEAKSPLVIYANAILPKPIALKALEPVIGRNPKVLYRVRSVEHLQLAKQHFSAIRRDAPRACPSVAFPELLKIFVGKFHSDSNTSVKQ